MFVILQSDTVAERLNKKLPVYRFYIHCKNGFDKLEFFCEHPKSFVEHFCVCFGTNRASFVSALPCRNGHLCS